MTIHLNTNPDDRKEMVKAISELSGLQATYMGPPSFAYQVGTVTIHRDGTIDYLPDPSAEGLIPMLVDRGWLDPSEYDLAADPEDDAESETPIPEPTAVVDMVAISLPLTDWTIPQLKNLLRLVCCKQDLIRRMTGNETLHLSRTFTEALCAKSYHESIADVQTDLIAGMDSSDVKGLSFAGDSFMMMFPRDDQNPAKWKFCGELMSGMMRMAKAATRVGLDSKATAENEKFYAHAWLVRMGYGGAEHKEFRAALLNHLNGYAAFKSEADMQAHKDKYAAIRRERRENRPDEEVA